MTLKRTLLDEIIQVLWIFILNNNNHTHASGHSRPMCTTTKFSSSTYLDYLTLPYLTTGEDHYEGGFEV